MHPAISCTEVAADSVTLPAALNCLAGQWGAPIFTWPSVLTMLAGALCAMVESLGETRAGRHIVTKAAVDVVPPAHA